MTTAVITLPLNGATSAASAANKAGYVARVLTPARTAVRGAGTWITSLPGTSRVLGAVGAAARWSRGMVGRVASLSRRADVRWLLVGLLTTAEGQNVLAKIARLVLKVTAKVGLIAYGIIRKPLSWIGVEHHLDNAALWSYSKVKAGAAVAAPYLTRVTNPDGPIMRAVDIVASVQLLRVLPYAVLGKYAVAAKILLWSVGIYSVAKNATAIALSFATVRNFFDRLLVRLDGFDHTNDNLVYTTEEVKVAQAAYEANPDSEKARKDLVRAQKIEQDLLKRKATQMAVDAQMALLEDLGPISYAIRVREKHESVVVFPGVMSRNEAFRILRKHGQPTKHQGSLAYVPQPGDTEDDIKAMSA
jgi:hypothetical protein